MSAAATVRGPGGAPGGLTGRFCRAAAALPVLVLAACAAVGDLPPVDLSAPGWTTWHGQALWQPSAKSPAIAGELLAARNHNGSVLVNFSKSPLPIFTARSTDDVWKIEFVERDRSYSGHGSPPRRFIWFRLPDILEGAPPPKGWHIERGSGELRLSRKGERLRLVLDE